MSASDDSPTHAIRRQYRSKIGGIAKLPELEMRTASLRETLVGLPPEIGICWLDQLVRGAIWGRSPNLDLVLALAYGLAEESIEGGTDYSEAIDEWRSLALQHELETVAFLFRDLPAHQTLPDESELPEIDLPIERNEITVGKRRMIAKTGDRDYIDRFVFDRHPLVIENLLDNPKLDQSDVLRIVTRRPTRPELLYRVARHGTWFGRKSVRKGLAHNPYTPTGLGLKLLPTLGIDILRKIQYGSDLHPALIDAADHLVTLREKRTAPWEV